MAVVSLLASRNIGRELGAVFRDGKNDVMVRYFSQNHGVSVTNIVGHR